MRRTATTVLTLLSLARIPIAHAQTGSTNAAEPAPAPASHETAKGPMEPDEPIDAPSEVSPAAPAEAHVEAPPPKPVERPRFGGRGQIVISAFSSLGISSTKYAESDASRFSAGVSPGIDYFFEKNISVGLDLNAEYDQSRGYGADSSLIQTTSTTFGAGLRVGVNVPLGDWFSLYPRVTLSAATSTTKEEVVNGRTFSTAGLGTPADGTEHIARVFVYVPVLAHLAPGFFAGFGPSFGHDLARKNTALTYQNLNTGLGAQAIVGGWF